MSRVEALGHTYAWCDTCGEQIGEIANPNEPADKPELCVSCEIDRDQGGYWFKLSQDQDSPIDGT